MSKNDQILDAADKSTGPRTCPECGYPFPFSLFIKRFVMKYGFPKWTCPNCRKFIKYNYSRANLIGAVMFIACILSFQGLQIKLGWELPVFIFIIPYFFFAFILLNLDTFQKYK